MALAKEPEDRYQTGAELGAALADAIAQNPAGLSTLSHKSVMDRVEVQLAAYPLPPLPPAATRPTETQPRQPTPTLAHTSEPVASPSLETGQLWTDNRPDLSTSTTQPRWFYGLIVAGLVIVGLTLLVGLIYAFSGSDDDKAKSVAQTTASVTPLTLEPSPTLADITTQTSAVNPANNATPTPLILPTTALPQPNQAPTLTQISPPTSIPPTSVPPTSVPPTTLPPSVTPMPPTATVVPPTLTPVPPTNVPPTNVPATTPIPSATPAQEGDYSFTLVILRNTTPGSESLLISNNQKSTGALDLNKLRLGEAPNTLLGSYWSGQANQLAQDECLALYRNANDPNLPSLKCANTYSLQFPQDSNVFWLIPFTIYYDNHEVGSCFAENEAICQVNIESQPPQLIFVRLDGKKGVIVYNQTGQDIPLSSLEIYDDKDKLIEGATAWGIDTFSANTCVRLWKDNELKKKNISEEELLAIETDALDNAAIDCTFIGDRAEFKKKEQFWDNSFSINGSDQTQTCAKDEDICELAFGN